MNRQSVLIHCHAGMQRSAAVLACYLIRFYKMTPEDAVNQPKFHHQWLPDEIMVENDFNESTLHQLEAMGYKMVKRGEIGRTELIEIKNGKTRK